MTSHPTVLVADDDPILRLVAAQLLEEAGYAYVLAEDGQQALDHLEKATVDIVVLDMIMPGKDGVETLRAIKSRWPSLPVLMISAGSRAMEPSVLLGVAGALGADGVLSKPLSAVRFIAALEAAAAKARGAA